MPVNKQQNDWTARQLFNPNTLVLRSADGKNITVNARTGRPADEVVTLPVAGTMVGFIQAGAQVTQVLTNTDTVVQFGVTGLSNGITRTGPNFTAHAVGMYLVYVWFHVQQNANSNVTKFWVTKNGVVVPYFGTTVELKNSGDELSVSDQAFTLLNDGDVLTVHAITSTASGAALIGIPAAAPAPEIMAASIQIVGYLNLT